jgi:hypothetical protein
MISRACDNDPVTFTKVFDETGSLRCPLASSHGVHGKIEIWARDKDSLRTAFLGSLEAYAKSTFSA